MEQILKFSRLSKELMEKELEDRIKDNPNFIISKYIGLKTNDINSLRREMNKVDSEFFVIKNRLGRRVFNKLKMENMSKDVDGGCGITFIGKDPAVAAKLVVEFNKKHEPFQVQSAFIEGKRLDYARLKELADLPTKNVLLAMAFAAFQAPVTGFVGVLSGVSKKLLYALNAIKDKKNENK